MKILIVSEALGEPNHKRGIFHFTRELIRSLSEDGHELTLLVETTRRYRALRRRQQKTKLFPAHSRAIELLALYRFLDEADMAEPTRNSRLRRTVNLVMQGLRVGFSWEFVACWLRALSLLPLTKRRIANDSSALEYIPTDLRHLGLFSDFRPEPGFYSYQDSSALLRLPAPRIDGRGFDLILIDTPTRVIVQRDPGAKVICVVHDLLPLTDMKLSDMATRIFLSRLGTSLKQADELAFVSRYSRDRFRELLPDHAHLPARVVYPRTLFDALPAMKAMDPAGPFARPTFVVIVSAEPRKNLPFVIRAFRDLPQADLVVIGYTGGADLMRNVPPNVRFSGYVDEQEKKTLIGNAHGLIMPSLAEGFGVPIIEALAAGTPVLCSDIPVFREVAGDLAEYFDPFSTRGLCASVERVIARQNEGRERIRAQHGELAERFGYHTQARDFFMQAVPAELLVAAQ